MWKLLIDAALKLLPNFLVGFIPQKDDTMADGLYWWRWRSVACGFLATIMSAFAVCATFNIIPFFKSPYALAGEVEKNRTSLQTITATLEQTNHQLARMIEQQKEARIGMLYDKAVEARRYQCRAQASNDRGAKPFWDERFAELRRAYKHATGDDLNELNDCRAF